MSEKVLNKNQAEKQAEKQAAEEKEKRKDDLRRFHKKLTELETEDIGRRVLYEYFSYKMPTLMLSDLVNTDGEKNTKLTALIQKNMNNLIEDYNKTPDENIIIEIMLLKILLALII